jgi:chromosome segregation ATPase
MGGVGARCSVGYQDFSPEPADRQAPTFRALIRRLSMRYLSATLGVRSLAVPLAALLLMTFARPGLAQGGPDIQTPVEVRSVEVRSVEGGADVFVGVNNGAEWTADQGPNDTLIIRLPRSVPGPRALDVTPSTGFVSRVEVGFGVPEGVPTSKLTVHARQSFRHRVIRERNRLRVELRLTGAEGPRTGEATRPTPQAIGPTSEPRPDTSPESSGGQVDELELGGDRIAGLERALARERARSEQSERLQAELQVRLDEVQRDSETHRQRVSALHADRLQLIEDLRIAREVAAEASSDADAGRANAVDQQDLAAIVGERDAARSEAADLRRQLEARETALAEVVDNREKLAGELAASEDRRREESAELALVSEELVSLRTSRQDASLLEQTLAGVTSDRDRLAREFEAASGNVENARAAQLAETVALRQQLQELQSARDSVAQRLSEVERDRGRSQAEGERLSSDLAAARTRLAAGLEEESAESAALRSRVAALSQSVSDAETAAGKAAKDLEASRERSRQLEQALADARRETESGESEALNGLRTQLEESRRNEADLRGWLSRAPRLLGVSSMAVARTVSPCLSLRPQPSLESPVLDCLSPGTVVEVLSMRADWLRVRLADRREGWVGQRFMEASTSNDLAQLTAASQRANKDAEKLRSDRDALRTRIAELERQSEEAREAASRELSAHTEEIERFRSQLAAATAETSSLENRLADAVSKSAGLAEMEAELATASMAAVEAQATIAALQLANDRLSGERQLREAVAEDRDLLAAKADSAARRIEELETALAAAELNGERLGASLSAASEELTALSQAAAEADGLRRRASGRSEAIEELAAQIEGLRSELADAQSALAQSRSDLLSSDSLVRDKMLRFTEIAGTGAVVVSSAAEPCLKLRTGPAAAAEAFDCVEPGTRFTLLDVDQEWIEVAASGDRRGWV